MVNSMEDLNSDDRPSSGNNLQFLSSMAKVLLGHTLEDVLNTMPKGSTPNKYKPHIGAKQIAKAKNRMQGKGE